MISEDSTPRTCHDLHTVDLMYIKKKKKMHTPPPAVRSKFLSKLIFAPRCVWHSDRAYYWVCACPNSHSTLQCSSFIIIIVAERRSCAGSVHYVEYRAIQAPEACARSRRSYGSHRKTWASRPYIQWPVAPVAYQVILEPGIGQFRESNPPECILVYIRGDLILCTNWLAERARAWVSNTRWKTDEQWDCRTLCVIKIEGKNRGEEGATPVTTACPEAGK